MREIFVVLVGIVIGMLAGCRTSATSPCSHTRSGQDHVAQILALSNQVNRLSQRIETMEQDWKELKPDIQSVQQLMNEMRYAPVVHEELIGVSTNKHGKE